MTHFQKIKVLGQGNYGIVHLVKDGDSQKYYALKQLNKECQTQTELMKSLQHPNIVRMYKLNQQESAPMILLEYVECGDLTNYLSSGFELQQNLIVSLLSQTALALYHCHFDHDIIHRDVKLENILLSSNGLIKLADFGISKKLKKDQRYESDNIGTPVNMCPQRISNGFYDFKSDIWSLGCVFYELMSKSKPFAVKSTHHSRQKLRQKIIKQNPQPLPERYSEWLRNLVFSMLSKDSQKRPSSQQILEKKEIQRELLRLRDKYPEYKSCKYMSVTLDNPKTAKFTQRQQKQFHSIPISIAQSMKTSKSRMSSSQLKIVQAVSEKGGCKKQIDQRFYSISLPFLISEAKKRRQKQ